MAKDIDKLRAAVTQAALDHQRHHRVGTKARNGVIIGEAAMVKARHDAEAALYQALHGRNIGDPK